MQGGSEMQGQLVLRKTSGRPLAFVIAVAAAALLSGSTGFWLGGHDSVAQPANSAATDVPGAAVHFGGAIDPYEGSSPAISGGNPAVAEPGS
jgi:hypothetical protein